MIGADGEWTYTLDNGNPVVDALNPGSTPLKDSIVVRTADGTTHRIVITVKGANERRSRRRPRPRPRCIATCEDQPITVDALANDSDVDGDALTSRGERRRSCDRHAEVVSRAARPSSCSPRRQNYHGPAVIDYTVSDGHGGTDTAVVKVTVKPVNDAPSGADKAIATNEDSTQVLTWADFGFSDPTDSPADAALSVKISSVPNAGSLMLNGVAVALGQEILKAEIDAGKLTFAPAPNANGDGYASFDFQVRDDGGTAHNGADLDPTPNTITFNVIPQNDAPVANDDGGPGHDAIATCEDQPITVDALANDSDVDGDALTIVSATVADPATGTPKSCIENGKTVIKFTPAENYTARP